VKGFYDFHKAKSNIEEWLVSGCIQWLRDEGIVPTGVHFRPSEPEADQVELVPPSQPNWL